jgi:hypothetical protein
MAALAFQSITVGHAHIMLASRALGLTRLLWMALVRRCTVGRSLRLRPEERWS